MGAGGPFSAIVLTSLLDAGCDVRLVVVPGASATLTPSRQPPKFPAIPVTTRRDLVSRLADERGLPLHHAERPIKGAQSPLSGYPSVDLVIVACFPFILPGQVLTMPEFGFLNLHPSLLPAYRGPVPLFWQFRAGVRTTGVTLHVMTEQIDAGAVVAQKSVPVPAGISGPEINASLASVAGEMATSVILSLPQSPLVAKPQDERESSYLSWPTKADFCIPATWTAERAFRFMRGTEHWGVPYAFEAHGKTYWLREALAWKARGQLKRPVVQAADGILVQLSPGVLRASRAAG